MFSDEGKISQILRNFISNALKFTGEGSDPGIGDDGVARGDSVLRVRYRDRDCAGESGIDFREFTQLDHPLQRRFKGTGLGLSLSKKLATLLGGERIGRKPGGSGGRYSICRCPLRHKEPTQEKAAEVAEWVRDPASLPVLVLEDGAEMMMAYQSYLKGSGFQVLPATTIRAAEDILHRERPAAIIADILLRGEDSWAFLARLKQDEETRSIPLIIASTVADHGKGYHLGADRYLLKPLGVRWC